jgi:hypothetical protein
MSLDHLRRHETRRAAGPRATGFGGIGPNRDPQVGQLGRPVLGDQDVGRRDIPMHHLGGMHRGQRVSDLRTDLRGPARRQRTVGLEDLGQRPRRQVLHHQPTLAVGDHRLEHRDDVGVLQPGTDPRLPAKLVAVARGGTFHRHHPAQLQVPGPPHGTHATRANELVEPVLAGDNLPRPH